MLTTVKLNAAIVYELHMWKYCEELGGDRYWTFILLFDLSTYIMRIPLVIDRYFLLLEPPALGWPQRGDTSPTRFEVHVATFDIRF